MPPMETRLEGRAQAEQTDPAASQSSLASSTAEAIERILARTESAAAAIRGRAEQQARQMAADLELRAVEEAIERRTRLEQLHSELASRAAALGVAYEAIGEQLTAVEAALSGWVAGSGFAAQAEAGQARVAAIRMTLRERRRIDVPYDGAPPSGPGGAQPPPPFAGAVPLETHAPRRRRWWTPWQREAA